MPRPTQKHGQRGAPYSRLSAARPIAVHTVSRSKRGTFEYWIANCATTGETDKIKAGITRLGERLWSATGQFFPVARIPNFLGMKSDAASKVVTALRESGLASRVNGRLYVSEYYAIKPEEVTAAAAQPASRKVGGQAAQDPYVALEAMGLLKSPRLQHAITVGRLRPATILRKAKMYEKAGFKPRISMITGASDERIKAHIAELIIKRKRKEADVRALKRIGVLDSPQIQRAISKGRDHRSVSSILRKARFFTAAGLKPEISMLIQASDERIQKRVAELLTANAKKEARLRAHILELKELGLWNPTVEHRIGNSAATAARMVANAKVFRKAGLDIPMRFIFSSKTVLEAEVASRKKARSERNRRFRELEIPIRVDADAVFKRMKLAEYSIIRTALKRSPGMREKIARGALLFEQAKGVSFRAKMLFENSLEEIVEHIAKEKVRLHKKQAERERHLKAFRESKWWGYKCLRTAVLKGRASPEKILRVANLFAQHGLRPNVRQLRWAEERARAYIEKQAAD